MKKIVNSYQDALDIRYKLVPKQTSGWHFLYRGHASTSFELLSMVGRKEPLNHNLLDSEQMCYKDYLNLIKVEDWLRFKPKSCDTDLFYMSLGRHLGLDCRLLDWTASLDTALYFASNERNYQNDDGHLWIMAYDGNVIEPKENVNPFDIKELTLIKEDYRIPNRLLIDDMPLGALRRFKQNGFFTIQPSYQTKVPVNELGNENLCVFSIIIKAEAKKDILVKGPRDVNYLQLNTNSAIEDNIKVINAKYFKQ